MGKGGFTILSNTIYDQFQDTNHIAITNYEIKHLIELTSEFIVKIKNQTYKNNIESEMNDLLHSTDKFLYRIKLMQGAKE